MDAPETRYTKSGDVRIAYEVFATDDVITTMDAAGSSKASVLGVGEASPGDVLVSSTVRDLVAGSGISFADRGELSVNGVPERWHLFSVVDV